MSDAPNFGFAQFVPGFDFLQNLGKASSPAVPQMPNVANWIAPTLSVEDLEKRIAELKAVHFWLEQNSRALQATVQALEVQKMTLATLKGMNFSLGEMANTFKANADAVTASFSQAGAKPAAEPVQEAKPAEEPAKPAAGLIDPLQLWSSLTQQFQTIAASAMTEASKAGSAMTEGQNQMKAAAQEVVKEVAKASEKALSGVAAPKAPAAKKAATKVVAKAAKLVKAAKAPAGR